jgi:hypothetical protein
MQPLRRVSGRSPAFAGDFRRNFVRALDRRNLAFLAAPTRLIILLLACEADGACLTALSHMLADLMPRGQANWLAQFRAPRFWAGQREVCTPPRAG